MLQTPSATAYMGCIGKDANGDKMKQCCEKDGVITSYMVDESTPTGTCACLIEGIERSLCTNLSAPFLMQVPPFKAFILKSLPMADYLFCNETEAATFAETEGWETSDVKFIATRLSLVPSIKSSKRTVVITQGCDPTIVAINGHVTEYPVIALPKEKLVDTNGAGDSYVGGFLAALSKGLPMDKCCAAGAYAASIIVQHSGCTYPAKPDYTL